MAEIRRWVNSRVGRMVLTRRGHCRIFWGTEKISMSQLASPWRGENTSWDTSLLYSLFAWQRINLLFLSPSKLCLRISYQHCVQRTNILASVMVFWVCTNLQTRWVAHIHYAQLFFLYVKNYLIKRKENRNNLLMNERHQSGLWWKEVRFRWRI